jgi:glutamine amidotransferase
MIGIVDYGLGNLVSVAAAVARLGFEATVSAEAEVLWDCDKIILPGVGAFGDGMRNLEERELVAPLTRMVKDDGKPILGICLGSQLISRASDEFGLCQGLGWVDAHCQRLAPDEPGLRVPHVGWNDLIQVRDDPLFQNIPEDALFYYVHSYFVKPEDSDLVVGECDYGGRMASVLRRENICATQFHPEKSQRHGLTLLRNFLDSA